MYQLVPNIAASLQNRKWFDLAWASSTTCPWHKVASYVRPFKLTVGKWRGESLCCGVSNNDRCLVSECNNCLRAVSRTEKAVHAIFNTTRVLCHPSHVGFASDPLFCQLMRVLVCLPTFRFLTHTHLRLSDACCTLSVEEELLTVKLVL